MSRLPSTMAIDLQDKELFEPSWDPNNYITLQKNPDRLCRLIIQQGETFWLRYIITFRDWNYKKYFNAIKHDDVHFVKHYFPFCHHRCTFMLDILIINIYEILFTFPNVDKLKEFTSDLYEIELTKIHMLKRAVKNEKDYIAYETSSSFNWFGSVLGLPQIIKNKYLYHIGIPFLSSIANSLVVLLRRWTSRSYDKLKSIEINEKWETPAEWQERTFIPNKFEKYLARVFCNGLSEALGITHKPMSGYNKLIRNLMYGTSLDEEMHTSISCGCHFNKGLSDKHREIAEAMDLKGHIEREVQRKMLLEMAEQKFKQEMEEQEMENSNCQDTELTPKKKKKKHKKRGKGRTDIPSALESNGPEVLPLSTKTKKTEPINGETVSEGNKSEKFSSFEDFVSHNERFLNASNINARELYKLIEANNDKNDDFNDKLLDKMFIELLNDGLKAKNGVVKQEPIPECKDLSRIGDKLFRVEQCIHETGQLDLEHYNLLQEAGRLKNKFAESKAKENHNSTKEKETAKTKLKKCAGCFKEAKGLKKCALCKTENIAEPRYYCSRECQAEDWLECHRKEHNEGKLVKAKS